jgi:hypothetical protein
VSGEFKKLKLELDLGPEGCHRCRFLTATAEIWLAPPEPPRDGKKRRAKPPTLLAASQTACACPEEIKMRGAGEHGKDAAGQTVWVPSDGLMAGCICAHKSIVPDHVTAWRDAGAV